jgi:hypothetical protein
MEVILTSAIIGMGYYFNHKGLKRDKKYRVVKSVPQIIQPSGKTIYESRRSVDIWHQEQDMANRLFEDAKNPEKTNVGVPGPPMPRWRKIDGDQRRLPLEFDEHSRAEFTERNIDEISNSFLPSPGEIENKQSQMNVFDSYPTVGGWNGISLTGEPIDKRTFNHNNMVPYFGGSIKQNVDDRSVTAGALLETFTGNVQNYRNKSEIAPMFDPQANVGNVYGNQNLSDYNRERYVISNLRNNESPIEKVYVGPGLNQGYTATPNGGFQQEDTLLYVRPKTVDELRVKTKPKVTYYGRIVAGKKIGKTGKVGQLEKNRPDGYYINDPDRYFTTTGACVGPSQRPKEILKYVNRSTTILKSRFGSAGPTAGSTEMKRPKVAPTRRSALPNSGFRNLIASIFGNGDKSDYGKKNIMLRPTTKKVTGLTNARNGNIQAQNTTFPTRNGQRPRMTRKTNIVGNGRWAGNVGAVQTTSGVVYDPNNVARTTVKETTIHNSVRNNMAPQRPAQVPVYDPNDVTRTTVKETTIHDSVRNNMAPQRPAQVPVFDPNDVTRTTIKETTIDNDHVGNIDAVYSKTTTRDPTNLRMRPTQKEQFSDIQEYGQVSGQRSGSGYRVAKHKAPTTHRETTLTEYGGNAQGPAEGGYLVTKVQVPMTQKQVLSNIPYQGDAYASNEVRPQSYTAMENSTIRSNRETIDQNRLPATEGPKKGISKEDIHATTHRQGDIDNQLIRQRGLTAPDRIVSDPTISMPCAETTDKNTLPNLPIQERLDPGLLNAFRENPYTQPLDSFFFP